MFEKNLETHWTQLTDLLKREDKNGYPEFFYYYCRHITDPNNFQKYVLNLQYLFDLTKRPIKDARILDVGCGFGVDSMIMASMGAREVCGIDVNPSWVESIEKYMKELKWQLPIKVKVADAAKLPYPDNTFDFLISVEAISHYRNVEGFFNEAHRVLKRGGMLIVSDANNGANPFIRKKTDDIWERFEFGPPTKSFHGHRIQKSFRDMRREIIVERFPKMKTADVDRLVDNTFAMGSEDIIKAVERFSKDGAMPHSQFKKGVPAFNPVMNDFIERVFDPTHLAKQLRQIGFNVKTFAHFGGAGKRDLVGVANSFLRMFSPLTIYAARVYKIVATKK
jgi:ubiquinone/menaquinone biosynthesis C-methylase UbiE